MRKLLFKKLLLAAGITLGACLLIYPLLLPTENYFRLVLQLLPIALITGLLLLIPIYKISENISRDITDELKTLKIDSKQTLSDYPELRPVARQITSIRMQMESQKNELEGQQEQLRVLTDNMQEGLLLISATGRVLSHNHAALQLLDKEKIKGEFDVFKLSDSRIFRDLVNNALNGIRGSAVMTVNDTACQLLANPVTHGSMMTGAVLVLLDVTEREKRDALRREFTSNVSHELKTPLTSIYGIADMMESGMVKAEDISGFACRIRDESARMIALIEDIIRLSRLDDDSFVEEVLPLDLYEIAENVRSQLMAQAEKKNIEMTLEGEAAPMQGVPVIVEEMLYNLCDNAIKYNNENGTVKMKVTCSEQSAIFTVTDDGIGIPQADKERIFERFYRVDKSHSKQIGGTGLGLSIVKHGAAFHNAKIELDSRLGSGTTITLFFPRSTDTAALAERDARRNPLDVEVPGTDTDEPLIHVHDAEAAAEETAPQPAETQAGIDPDEELIDEAMRETAPADAADEPDALPEPEPAPRAKTVLEANIEEIEAELEQELALFEPDDDGENALEQPELSDDDEEIRRDDTEPEPVRQTARITFDPDIVPIDETTMDIKI